MELNLVTRDDPLLDLQHTEGCDLDLRQAQRLHRALQVLLTHFC
jgi:hypothetical protein